MRRDRERHKQFSIPFHYAKSVCVLDRQRARTRRKPGEQLLRRYWTGEARNIAKTFGAFAACPLHPSLRTRQLLTTQPSDVFVFVGQVQRCAHTFFKIRNARLVLLKVGLRTTSVVKGLPFKKRYFKYPPRTSWDWRRVHAVGVAQPQ